MHPKLRLIVAQFIAVYLCTCLYAQSDNTRNLEAELKYPIPAQTDATSIKIINAHNLVKGGLENIYAIRNLELKGKLLEGKQDYTIKEYRRAPGSFRIETSQKKMGRIETNIEGYNGTTAWEYDLRSKHPLPDVLGKAKTKLFKRKAPFYGKFVNWEQQGYVFQYQGEVKSRGIKNYLVRLFYPNGNIQDFYFDAKNFMVTRISWEEVLMKSIVRFDVFIIKYRKVDGVFFC